jgi:hypothetical protein
MINVAKRTCPAPGCEAETARTLFCCQKHWFSLPSEKRYAVNTAYRGYQMAIAKKEGHKVLIEAVKGLREAQQEALTSLM